jgi:hypothetical protein|nr:hypothetical protein [Citrobacter rodentium]
MGGQTLTQPEEKPLPDTPSTSPGKMTGMTTLFAYAMQVDPGRYRMTLLQEGR